MASLLFAGAGSSAGASGVGAAVASGSRGAPATVTAASSVVLGAAGSTVSAGRPGARTLERLTPPGWPGPPRPLARATAAVAATITTPLALGIAVLAGGGSAGAVAFPSMMASARWRITSSIDRMLSSLPGIGRSARSGSQSRVQTTPQP